MTTAWLLLSGALLPGAVDCSRVEPSPTPDPVAARAYLEVGDAELKQGRTDTAAVAFRDAVRLDPSSGPARARMLELCRDADEARDEGFQRATRAVEEGRYQEAVELLEPMYRAQTPPDAATALLYGIALYERGDDRAARSPLERAREVPQTEDAASVFLGLLALRSGDSERALWLFERSSQTAQGELAHTAKDLSILARREARLAVSVQAEGGYDSNVDQAPDGSPDPLASGDALYGAMASVLFRPFGERNGPYAGGGARLRNLFEIHAYDLAWVGGTGGYRLGRGRSTLRVEYAYDAIWLGGAPFMFAHQVQLDGRLEVLGARAGAFLSARSETYQQVDAGLLRTMDLERYSGPTFDGEVTVGLGAGAGELWLRYRGLLHKAREEVVSWTDHGPGARVVVALFSSRLVLDGQITSRTYGAKEPGFGNLVRQDALFDGAATVEHDLFHQLTLYLSVGGRRAVSNVPELDYTRVAGSAGAIFTAGLW